MKFKHFINSLRLDTNSCEVQNSEMYSFVGEVRMHNNLYPMLTLQLNPERHEMHDARISSTIQTEKK